MSIDPPFDDQWKLDRDLLIQSNGTPGLSTIQALIDAKANVNAVDEEGWTPLQNAIYFGNDDVVHFLLSHSEIDVNQVTYHRLYSECFEYQTALFMAVTQKRQTYVRRLIIHHEANIHFVCLRGGTVLHQLASTTDPTKLHYTQSMFWLLMELGARPCLFVHNQRGIRPMDMIPSDAPFVFIRDDFAKAMEDTRKTYRAALNVVVPVSVLMNMIVQYIG